MKKRQLKIIEAVLCIIIICLICLLVSCTFDDKEICHGCGGTGKCYNCHGKGIVGVASTCTACNGSGKCHPCQGTGEVKNIDQ